MIDCADLEYLINKSYLRNDESRREMTVADVSASSPLRIIPFRGETRRKRSRRARGRLYQIFPLRPAVAVDIKYRHPRGAEKYTTYHP